MRSTIDKAGRLLVPRAMREAIGLAGGGPVDIELDGGGIRIEPAAGSPLREDDGLLLIPATGSAVGSEALRSLIDAHRSRR